MVNIKIEEVDLVSDDDVINYESLGKCYLQDKLKNKLIRNTDKGSPDYKYYFLSKCYYVEFKSNNDGLRKDQIRWILNNPEADLTIMWVNVVRTKDLNILSTNTRINNKLPFVQYDKKAIDRLNFNRNSFIKELNVFFDCNRRIPKSELTDSLSIKFGNEYTSGIIDNLIKEGFLFEPNSLEIERL